MSGNRTATNTDPPMPYEIVAEPKTKCNGVGWPTDGLNRCLGCRKDNPKLNRRELVAYHYMTVQNYAWMTTERGRNHDRH